MRLDREEVGKEGQDKTTIENLLERSHGWEPSRSRKHGRLSRSENMRGLGTVVALKHVTTQPGLVSCMVSALSRHFKRTWGGTGVTVPSLNLLPQQVVGANPI